MSKFRAGFLEGQCTRAWQRANWSRQVCEIKDASILMPEQGANIPKNICKETKTKKKNPQQSTTRQNKIKNNKKNPTQTKNTRKKPPKQTTTKPAPNENIKKPNPNINT